MEFNPTPEPMDTVHGSLGIDRNEYMTLAMKGKELYDRCAGDARTSKRILQIRDAMKGHDAEECAIIAVMMVEACIGNMM